MNKKEEMPIHHAYFKDKSISLHNQKGYKQMRLSTTDLNDIMEHFWALGYTVDDLAIDDDESWYALQSYKKEPSRLNFYTMKRLIDLQHARNLSEMQSVAFKGKDGQFLLINRLGAIETNDDKALHQAVKYLKTGILLLRQD